MTEIQTNEDGWRPCPAGTIGHVANRLRAQRRARAQRRVAIVSGACVAVGAVFVSIGLALFLDRSGEFNYGGITCSELEVHVPDYLQGTVDDPQMLARIDQHLAECPLCGPMVEQMRAEEATDGIAFAPSRIRAPSHDSAASHATPDQPDRLTRKSWLLALAGN